MITATDKHATYKVNGLTNRGQWFNKTWLILIGMGFEITSYNKDNKNG